MTDSTRLYSKYLLTKEEAYDDLLQQIKQEEKKSNLNQYYEIKHRIIFSHDDKKTPLYSFYSDRIDDPN